MEMIEHLVRALVVLVLHALVHVVISEGQTHLGNNLVHDGRVIIVQKLSLSCRSGIQEHVFHNGLRSHAEATVDDTAGPHGFAVREEDGRLRLLLNLMTGFVVKLREESRQCLFVPLLAHCLILVEKGLQGPYGIVQQILNDTFVISLADIGEKMALFVHDILFLDHLLAIQADHMAEQSFQGRGRVAITKRRIALSRYKIRRVAYNQAVPFREEVPVLTPAIAIHIFSNIGHIHRSNIQFRRVEGTGQRSIALRDTLVAVQDGSGFSNELTDVGDNPVDDTAVTDGKLTEHLEGFFCKNHLDTGFHPVLQTCVEVRDVVGIPAGQFLLEGDLKGFLVQVIQFSLDTVPGLYQRLAAGTDSFQNTRIHIGRIGHIQVCAVGVQLLEDVLDILETVLAAVVFRPFPQFLFHRLTRFVLLFAAAANGGLDGGDNASGLFDGDVARELGDHLVAAVTDNVVGHVLINHFRGHPVDGTEIGFLAGA